MHCVTWVQCEGLLLPAWPDVTAVPELRYESAVEIKTKSFNLELKNNNFKDGKFVFVSFRLFPAVADC